MKKISEIFEYLFELITGLFSVLFGVAMIIALIWFAMQIFNAKNKDGEYVAPETKYVEKSASSYESDTRDDNFDFTQPPEESVDEYGQLYNYGEESGEYFLNEDYQEEVETPDSTAFTRIWYWPFHEELSVEFRSSGVCYVYYDVPVEVWYSFKTAESKGSFFNSEIKGQYEYDRE